MNGLCAVAVMGGEDGDGSKISFGYGAKQGQTSRLVNKGAGDRDKEQRGAYPNIRIKYNKIQ